MSMLREFETALKAAGDPTRTRILKLLEGGPLCVCQVQAVLGLAPSTVSKHLTLLRAAGLVSHRRDGRWIHCALAAGTDNPYATAVLALLRASLRREPLVAADRARLRRVKAVPIESLCAPPDRTRKARKRRRAGAGSARTGRKRS
jgi:arsenate reductase/ArsR family transcriptional regulator